MSRKALAILIPTLAIALVGVWALVPPSPLPARFALDDCRHVALTDAATGHPIAGAEDLLLARDGETVIISAQDRLDTSRPEGGLYAVDLSDLAAGRDVMARPLVAPRGELGPFRPHGIALSPDGQRLAVVNHVSDDRGVIEIGPLGPDGWHPDRRIADPRFCRANDLDFVKGAEAEALRVTLDGADCATSIRDLGGNTGSVVLIEGETLTVERAGLDFANGILDGWVAETRGERLSGPDGIIKLPGGPDNLDLSEGRIIVAVHPKLLRTGIYIAGGISRVSSRILAVEPETGAIEILYDDPKGTVFSGATVGVLAGDRLIAGSVRDSGLLYCERPG